MGRLHISVAALLLLAGFILASHNAGHEAYTAGFWTGESFSGNLTLELADSAGERRRGLMNRRSLPENHGMLFVFPGEGARTFWMKNTYIPLDIVFLDRDMEVVDIDRAMPQPGVNERGLELYRSDSPAMYVLEARQNFTRRHGVEEGDRLVPGKSLRPELGR